MVFKVYLSLKNLHYFQSMSGEKCIFFQQPRNFIIVYPKRKQNVASLCAYKTVILCENLKTKTRLLLKNHAQKVWHKKLFSSEIAMYKLLNIYRLLNKQLRYT